MLVNAFAPVLQLVKQNEMIMQAQIRLMLNKMLRNGNMKPFHERRQQNKPQIHIPRYFFFTKV